MRNKVIHNYFDVDVSVVWKTEDDLPRLKQQVDDLLNEHRAPRPQAQEPDRSR